MRVRVLSEFADRSGLKTIYKVGQILDISEERAKGLIARKLVKIEKEQPKDEELKEETKPEEKPKEETKPKEPEEETKPEEKPEEETKPKPRTKRK